MTDKRDALLLIFVILLAIGSIGYIATGGPLPGISTGTGPIPQPERECDRLVRPGNDIQGALNSLSSGRTWKEKVCLKGNFSINAKIIIPSYTIIEIQGTITLASGSNVDMFENSDTVGGNTDIEIHGGTLDMNRAGNPTIGTGIAFGTVTNGIVYGVLIKNPIGSGLSNAGASRNVVFSNNIVDGGDCIGHSGEDILIIGNVCRNGDDGTITIETTATRRNILVAHNTIDTVASFDGIEIPGTSDVVLEGNIVKGAGRHGIHIRPRVVGPTTYYPNRTIVSGNRITTAVSAGIFLNGCWSCVVEGNIVEQNGVGIDLRDLHYSTVKNNAVRDQTDTSGIRFTVTSGHNVIEGNTSTDSRPSGSKTQDYGFEFQTNTYNDNRIMNNDFSGNQLGGIGFINGGLSGNSTIQFNTGYITENWGATSVADGGTVSHGLAGTPDSVTVTCSIASQMCSVTALAATTFTVAIKTDTGAAGTTQTVYWYAVFIP